MRVADANASVAHTSGIYDAIRDYDDIITIHSHPHSMSPSIEDINANHMYGYRRGIVVCHDGKVFEYSSSDEISTKLYDMYRNRNLRDHMSEYDAQWNALMRLMENYIISVREVIV